MDHSLRPKNLPNLLTTRNKAHQKRTLSPIYQRARRTRTFKSVMKASEDDELSLHIRISRFLANYRAAPHATTGISPSELFLQRKMRTKFDMLRPDIPGVVTSKQTIQKKYHDRHVRMRTFTSGQTVMARDYLSSKKWVPGVIVSRSGPLLYQIQLSDNRIII